VKKSVLKTYCTTKPINYPMDHNFPTDKFVLSVYVPQGIWALYIVLTSLLDLAVLENLANMVDSSERLKDPAILYMMAL
jgi:hypothetical protein